MPRKYTRRNSPDSALASALAPLTASLSPILDQIVRRALADALREAADKISPPKATDSDPANGKAGT